MFKQSEVKLNLYYLAYNLIYFFVNEMFQIDCHFVSVRSLCPKKIVKSWNNNQVLVWAWTEIFNLISLPGALWVQVVGDKIHSPFSAWKCIKKFMRNYKATAVRLKWLSSAQNPVFLLSVHRSSAGRDSLGKHVRKFLTEKCKLWRCSLDVLLLKPHSSFRLTYE